jgi:hypothetical protein
MDNWLNAKNKPNQTQFKPNAERAHKLLHYRTLHNQTVTPRAKNKPDSNPTPETNTSPYKAKTYTEKKPRGTDKNKPKQTRFQTPRRSSIARPASSSFSPVCQNGTKTDTSEPPKCHPIKNINAC